MLTPWLMSPWQATRIALEAQSLMTSGVLGLFSGTPTQTAAPGMNDRDAVGADREGSVTTRPTKKIAAHQAFRVDKKRLRPKNQRSNRKRTSKNR